MSSLDYIVASDAAGADILVDRIEELTKKPTNWLPFVDEAAPPKALFAARRLIEPAYQSAGGAIFV